MTQSQTQSQSELLLNEMWSTLETAKGGETTWLTSFLTDLDAKVAALESDMREREEKLDAVIKSKREELRQIEASLAEQQHELELTMQRRSKLQQDKLLSSSSAAVVCNARPWPQLSDDDMAPLRSAMHSFELDILSFSKNQLMVLVEDIFKACNVLERFKVEQVSLRNFIGTVCNTMRDNAYHNFHHVADVLQTVFVMLSAADNKLLNLFEPIEVFALLIAALCHDLEHPGVNNAFLVTSRSHLAVLYNDRSVLENHHCSQAFKILNTPPCNILKALSRNEYNETRAFILQSILATDMARHAEYISTIKNWAETIGDGGIGRMELKEKKERVFLMECLLKWADISNVVKPFTIAQKWAFRVVDEFFTQGDRERAADMAVTGMYDRKKQSSTGLQRGFIDFVCEAAFGMMAKLLPELKTCHDTVLHNRQCWAEFSDEKFAKMADDHLAIKLL